MTAKVSLTSQSLDAAEALAIVMDIAGRWGENQEEQFPRRINSTDSDDDLSAMVDGDPDELEEAIEIRQLWRALETVKAIIDQRGCEHFDSAVKDGSLTSLIDVVVFG